MNEKNKALFYRWVQEVWEKGNVGVIDEAFAAHGAAVSQFSLKSKALEGPRRYKSFVRLIRRHFKDIRITIDQIATDDQKIVAVCTFQATCAVESGETEATARAVKVSGLCQILIEDDKIVHLWNNLDLTRAIRDCQ